MSSLRDIRRRLRSTENIKKITDAMERVAAARLRRAQNLAEGSRPYFSQMKEIVARLVSSSEFGDPLFEQRPVNKSALIVISADKGLSGSYTSTILEASNDFLKNYAPDKMDLLLFGKKAIEHYQSKKWPIESKTIGWGGKITLDEIQDIANEVVKGFLAKKYDEVWIIYTHYISLCSRNVVLSKFLPIEKDQESQKNPCGFNLNYIFEPELEEILAKLLPRYCAIRIQEALYESYASELAARIMAMQMASKNSEEMMDALKRIRDKVRQEGITREMIEISSGVDK